MHDMFFNSKRLAMSYRIPQQPKVIHICTQAQLAKIRP
jgi:hypothetical protein